MKRKGIIMTVRCTLSYGLLLIELALTMQACAQTPPQTSATPTVDSAHLTAFAHSATSNASYAPTPTPIVASAANVGPVPKNCPLGPPLPVQRISPAIAPLAGISPVWATVGGGGVGHLVGDIYDPDGGWPVKIVWEIGPNYHETVRLRAGNLRDGTLLKWKMSPDDLVTTAPVLNPQHLGHPVSVIGPDWTEWGSAILIPAAGCYYVEASWPEGHWRDTFAIGL